MANALASFVGRGDVSEWVHKYNSSPDTASTYRGRVLITQSLRDTLPEASKGGPKGFRNGPEPWKRKCARLKLAQEPSEAKYTLRLALASGIELPRDFKKLCVVVSCGKTELRSTSALNTNGCAEWLFKGEVEVELPINPAYHPDVFVHLCKFESSGLTTPFCFARFKASDLLHKVKGEPGGGGDDDDDDDDGDDTDGSDEEGAVGVAARAVEEAEAKKKREKDKKKKNKKRASSTKTKHHPFWPEFR